MRYFRDSSRFLFNGNSYLQVHDATTFRPGVTIREAAFFKESALSTDGRKIIAIFNNGSTVKFGTPNPVQNWPALLTAARSNGCS